MKRKTRILLVEDELIVREAIAALLEMEPDIDVVGEAGNAKSGIYNARSLKPDIALLDMHLPDRSGLDVISTMLHDNPDLRIILLTAFADDEDVLTAFRAGAVGYVLKTQAVSDLVQAIENARNGITTVPPCIARILLKTLRAPARSTATTSILSEAEISVIADVARGLQNKEIARHLHISSATVNSRISHILSKLGLENRTQAALYAVKQGWVAPESASTQRTYTSNVSQLYHN